MAEFSTEDFRRKFKSDHQKIDWHIQTGCRDLAKLHTVFTPHAYALTIELALRSLLYSPEGLVRFVCQMHTCIWLFSICICLLVLICLTFYIMDLYERYILKLLLCARFSFVNCIFYQHMKNGWIPIM